MRWIHEGKMSEKYIPDVPEIETEQAAAVQADHAREQVVKRKFAALALVLGLVIAGLMPSNNTRVAGVETPRQPQGVTADATRQAICELGASILADYARHPDDPRFRLEPAGGNGVLVYEVVPVSQRATGKSLQGQYTLAVETQVGFAGLPDPNQITGVMVVEDMYPDTEQSTSAFFLNMAVGDSGARINADVTAPNGHTSIYENNALITDGGPFAAPALPYDTNMGPKELQQLVAWAESTIAHAVHGDPAGFLPGAPE